MVLRGLVALLGRTGAPDAAAKRKRHKNKRKCKGGKKKCGKRCIPKTSCCAVSDCPTPPPCHEALCQEDQCLTVLLPQGAPCASGLSCVVNQTCDEAGECQGGAPDDSRCPSSNLCRAGRCDPEDDNSDLHGCVFDPIEKGDESCGLGACQRTVPRCVAGEVQQCVPGEPSLETCNGIDDDCDGVVDGPGLCPVDDPATCGSNGVCAGGVCQKYGAQTICQPAFCEGSTLHLAARCDGNGNCSASQTRECAPFGCSSVFNACIGSCGGDPDCAPGNICVGGQCRPKKENGEPCDNSSQCASGLCDRVRGTCQPKRADGAECTFAEQCVSGFCVANVCCSEACAGADKICTGGICQDA